MNHRVYFEKAKKEYEENIATEKSAVAKYLSLYYENIYSELDEDVFNSELCDDLFGREPELLESLSWFYENGFDFNAEHDIATPLGYAVMEADAPMVEYLILHGAEPLDNNNKDTKNNYYMEDLDVQLLQHLRGGEHFNAILQTARMLAKNGVTYGNYLCIEIDRKNRAIRVSSPKYKY